jgi:hypothetical protein
MPLHTRWRYAVPQGSARRTARTWERTLVQPEGRSCHHPALVPDRDSKLANSPYRELFIEVLVEVPVPGPICPGGTVHIITLGKIRCWCGAKLAVELIPGLIRRNR